VNNIFKIDHNCWQTYIQIKVLLRGDKIGIGVYTYHIVTRTAVRYDCSRVTLMHLRFTNHQ